MFAYLNGTLEEIEKNQIVLDVNGVGYMLTVPNGVVDKLPSIGNNVKLYTYLINREDTQELYGFIDKQQKTMFEKLITVSGIGPKGALSVLSALSTDEIVRAIISEDITSLTKAAGVGKKTAQRIILDLKDKMDDFDIIANIDGERSTLSRENPSLDEVAEALMTLGYSQTEIKMAMSSLTEMDGDTSTLVKAALKSLDT